MDVERAADAGESRVRIRIWRPRLDLRVVDERWGIAVGAHVAVDLGAHRGLQQETKWRCNIVSEEIVMFLNAKQNAYVDEHRNGFEEEEPVRCVVVQRRVRRRAEERLRAFAHKEKMVRRFRSPPSRSDMQGGQKLVTKTGKPTVETAPSTMHAFAQRRTLREICPSRMGRLSTARWNWKLNTHVHPSAIATTVSPTQKM